MKKYSSQIAVALVCCVLGFMLAYQFRVLNKQAKLSKTTGTTTDITVEIEQYKKQKDEMQKNIDDLQAKLKVYEQSAANKSEETKGMLTELENIRLLIGTEDVQGPGVVLYLNPKSSILGADIAVERITDKHLIYIVNELVSAGAEAVSINDIRITPRTGITTSGNYILVNEERVSPLERITIKAIGDKQLLYSTLSFPGVLTDFNSISKYDYKSEDNIVINKHNTSTTFKYAKPVKQK
jgi:uncharacterized protein YlxW (UPF0749 family)